MPQTAKVFMTGRSQAVRLPAEFRFQTDEVHIRRDPESGDVILSARPGNWQVFLAAVNAVEGPPDDFMAERGDELHERGGLPLTARFMLDTNMATAMIKGLSPQALRRLAETPTRDIAISVITEAELLFGLAKNPATKHAGAARAFLATVAIMPWTSLTAAVYAQLRTDLEAAGTPLKALDTLIAAHAKAVGSTLVTDDRAFRHVEGLGIENWLEGNKTIACRFDRAGDCEADAAPHHPNPSITPPHWHARENPRPSCLQHQRRDDRRHRVAFGGDEADGLHNLGL